MNSTTAFFVIFCKKNSFFLCFNECGTNWYHNTFMIFLEIYSTFIGKIILLYVFLTLRKIVIWKLRVWLFWVWSEKQLLDHTPLPRKTCRLSTVRCLESRIFINFNYYYPKEKFYIRWKITNFPLQKRIHLKKIVGKSIFYTINNMCFMLIFFIFFF